jgi:hypothetical protein
MDQAIFVGKPAPLPEKIMIHNILARSFEPCFLLERTYRGLREILVGITESNHNMSGCCAHALPEGEPDFCSNLATMVRNTLERLADRSVFENIRIFPLSTTNFSWTVRGCLHVSESPYELPYDSVHNLYANRIGIQLFFCHP